MFARQQFGAETKDIKMDAAIPGTIAAASAVAVYHLLGVASDPFAWSEAVVHLATSAGFGGLVWYLIVRTWPSIQERHDKQMAAEKSYQHERDLKLDASLDKIHEDIVILKEKLK